MQILTDKNFVLYCAQNYQNPACHSTEEFQDDIRRIKYVKKLCTRVIETGEIKERLILNHIIVLANVFSPEPLNRILFLKAEPYFSLIKPFLLYLNVLPDYIINVKYQRIIYTEDIAMEPRIINILRTI
jgi:hypothetical protein